MSSEADRKRRKRDEDATRPIPREELKIDISSKRPEPVDPTMDLELDDVEVVASKEEMTGDQTGKIPVKKPPPSPVDDDELEEAALPGLGSKLKRLAKQIRKK